MNGLRYLTGSVFQLILHESAVLDLSDAAQHLAGRKVTTTVWSLGGVRDDLVACVRPAFMLSYCGMPSTLQADMNTLWRYLFAGAKKCNVGERELADIRADIRPTLSEAPGLIAAALCKLAAHTESMALGALQATGAHRGWIVEPTARQEAWILDLLGMLVGQFRERMNLAELGRTVGLSRLPVVAGTTVESVHVQQLYAGNYFDQPQELDDVRAGKLFAVARDRFLKALSTLTESQLTEIAQSGYTPAVAYAGGYAGYGGSAEMYSKAMIAVIDSLFDGVSDAEEIFPLHDRQILQRRVLNMAVYVSTMTQTGNLSRFNPETWALAPSGDCQVRPVL